MRTDRFPHRRRRGLTHRRGFTLVEILVVLGIIGVILSIALPVTFKARRQAARAQAARDLGALSMGLEEYKNQFGAYPATNGRDGASVLMEAMTGLYWDAPSVSLKPLRDPKSGRPRSAVINVESFNIRTNLPVNGATPVAPAQRQVWIRDRAYWPCFYFPATVPRPSLQPGGGGFVRTNSNPRSLYNYADIPSSSYALGPEHVLHDVTQSVLTLSQADMQKLLGDTNASGFIDAGETPQTVAPFLLWFPGPDGAYGLDINGKCDDVTNFDIPAQYVR